MIFRDDPNLGYPGNIFNAVMTCAAIILGLLLLCALAPSADARTPVYARVKCIGLYCMIVTEPDPPLPARAATWRRGWVPR